MWERIEDIEVIFEEIGNNEWTKIPQIPFVEFLNLQHKVIDLGSKERKEVSLTYTYDQIRKEIKSNG